MQTSEEEASAPPGPAFVPPTSSPQTDSSRVATPLRDGVLAPNACENPFLKAAKALGLETVPAATPVRCGSSSRSSEVSNMVDVQKNSVQAKSYACETFWSPKKRSSLVPGNGQDACSPGNTEAVTVAASGQKSSTRPERDQLGPRRPRLCLSRAREREAPPWRPPKALQSPMKQASAGLRNACSAISTCDALPSSAKLQNARLEEHAFTPWRPCIIENIPAASSASNGGISGIEDPQTHRVDADATVASLVTDASMEDAWSRALLWIQDQQRTRSSGTEESEQDAKIQTAAESVVREVPAEAAAHTQTTEGGIKSTAPDHVATTDDTCRALWPLQNVALYQQWLMSIREQWLERVGHRQEQLLMHTTSDTSGGSPKTLGSLAIAPNPTKYLRSNAYPAGEEGERLRQKHRQEIDALVQEGRDRLEQLLGATQKSLAAITNELRRQEHVLLYVRVQHAYERRILRERGTVADTTPRLSAEAHVQHALRECIYETHPRVFSVPDEWASSRKLRAVRHALEELVRFNPVANGMQARREWARRQRLDSQTLVKPAPPTAASSKPLPFEAALRTCIEVLGEHRFERPPPTLETLGDHLKRIRATHPAMYTWYQDLHDVVQGATYGNALEMHLFLSLLATCSPNSSIAANTINALLNYRAISQVRRPRFGSYPMNSLLNYLAGCLGVPSGSKVTAFLDNLLHPDTSQRITVDTHMQKVLLGGSGRLTLNAREYEAIEAVFRAAAEALNEPCPCRLQSCLWTIQAGPISYAAELVRYRRRAEIELHLAETEHAAELERDPELVARLGHLLLELGYLNEFERVIVEARSVLRVQCFVYVPIRRETVRGMRAHIAMRLAFARRQRRTLLPRERAELALFESSIAAAEASGHIESQLEHFEDRKHVVADLHRYTRLVLHAFPYLISVAFTIHPAACSTSDALEMPLLRAEMGRSPARVLSSHGSRGSERTLALLPLPEGHWVGHGADTSAGQRSMQVAALSPNQASGLSTAPHNGFSTVQAQAGQAVVDAVNGAPGCVEAATTAPTTSAGTGDNDDADPNDDDDDVDDDDDDGDDDDEDDDWDPYFGTHQWFTDARQRFGIQTLWHS